RRAVSVRGHRAAGAVYYRPRVTVVLALYAGSGRSRAYARALITARSQPRTGRRSPAAKMGVAGSRKAGCGAPGRRNPDVTRQGPPDRRLRAAAIAGRSARRAPAR